MSNLAFDFPEGPVTIMFTDVVGSTSLRTTLGDQQADQLFREHDQLVREQIAENQGRDQTAALGDGFLAVFVSTRRALVAAVGIQRALDTFNRSRPGPPLQVRIGLNTGEVAWQDGQLSGEAVHAASRVCAAADGGQILVSDVTRQLAGTVPDLSFLDTGEHDLKGFPHPWRLWEAVWVRETTQLPQQVFVARDDELAFLRSKLNRALQGQGGLVLVGGEPGVGKTTLVRQLIREAESQGALALLGRCYDIEGAPPYSPFVEMLEQGLAVMPPEIVREDMGEDASEVARLVPELRRRFPDIPAPLDLPPEQQRRYFFNAVGAFISRGAARFPLVLVMDDVHWADVPTLLLIEHMAELSPGLRLLGVGTYRDVELDVSRPLAATIERLVRDRLVDRLSIKRFDRDGVAHMVEALASKPPPSAVVDAIFDETEGNPFFVEEVFRHLVEEDRIFDASGDFRTDLQVDELDVPESVRLVVGRRLERLGREAQRALAAGAVVGRGFPFTLLEAISDVDSNQLLDIVEEAEAARVIVPEERSGEVHYSFAHELIRQTLLTSLSLLRRQRLHLAVANAMERDAATRTSRPSEIAHHLLQAGAAAEVERTLDYLERAMDRAMEGAAFEEALRHAEDGLALVENDRGLRRARLMERRGEAVRGLGRFEDCLAIWSEVVEAYAGLGEVERAAELCYEMGYQLAWLSRFPEAFEIYARGVTLLGDRRSSVRAGLIAGAGLITGFGGLFDLSQEQLAEAEDVAREIGDEGGLGRVNWARCIVNWSFIRIPEAQEAGRQAIEQFRRAGDAWLLVDALAWVSFPLGCSGDYAAGEAAAAEAFEQATRLGHVAGEILARRGLMLNRSPMNADLEAIDQGIRKDLDLCLGIGSPWSSQSYAWIGIVSALRGKPDDGLAAADEAIRIEPDSAWRGIGWVSRLLNRTYAGDASDVRSMIDARMPGLLTVSDPLPIGPLMTTTAAAEVAAVFGFTDVATELYPLVAAQADRLVIRPFDWALTQRVAGMTAAAAARWDDAERHFDEALSLAHKLPNALDEPHVHHWFGKMLLDRGNIEDRDRGRHLLSRAIEGYRRIGIPIRADMADETLRSNS